MSSTNWIDAFLFWDFVLVTILIFSDFLMYPDEREKLKEKIGDLWVFVEDNSIQKLMSKNAEKFFKWSIWITGIREPFSPKKYLSAVLILVFKIAFISFCVTTLLKIIYLGDFHFYSEENRFFAKYGKYHPGVYYYNIIFDVLSCLLTIFFIYLMSKTNHLLLLLMLLLADVFFAYVAFRSVWYSMWNENFNIIQFLVNHSFFLPPDLMSIKKIFAQERLVFVEFSNVVLFLASTTIVPTCIHMIITLFFMFFKVFRVVLKPLLSRILYLFHDSKHGVFTLFSILLGTIAKILQMFVKVYLA